jgi:hypothetical protein
MKLAALVKTSFAISIVMTIIAAFVKIAHRGGAEVLLIISLLSILTFIVAAIYEVRSSDKINNMEKLLWTIGFIFFSGVTGLVYILVGRKHIAMNY